MTGISLPRMWRSKTPEKQLEINHDCLCLHGMRPLGVHNITSILLVRIPGVYLTSKLFPASLFPMGIATACGSLLSVIICLSVFVWLEKHGWERKYRNGR